MSWPALIAAGVVATLGLASSSSSADPLGPIAIKPITLNGLNLTRKQERSLTSRLEIGLLEGGTLDLVSRRGLDRLLAVPKRKRKKHSRTPKPKQVQRWTQAARKRGAETVLSLDVTRTGQQCSYFASVQTLDSPLIRLAVGFRLSCELTWLGRGIDKVASMVREQLPKAKGDAASLVAIWPLDLRKVKLHPTLRRVAGGLLATGIGEGGRIRVAFRTKRPRKLPTCPSGECKQPAWQRKLLDEGFVYAVSPAIHRAGRECLYMAALYDLRASKTLHISSRNNGCGVDQMVTSTEKMASDLNRFLVDRGTGAGSQP